MRERLFLANWMTQGTCSWNTILKRVIYALYFAFYNVFLRPTCNRRCAMLCRGWCPSIWTEWQNYHTTLIFWDKQGYQLFSGDTVCVTNCLFAALPRSSRSRAAPRQGLSEELSVIPVFSLMHPSISNILGRACCWWQGPSRVPGVTKRPGPESDA